MTVVALHLPGARCVVRAPEAGMESSPVLAREDAAPCAMKRLRLKARGDMLALAGQWFALLIVHDGRHRTHAARSVTAAKAMLAMSATPMPPIAAPQPPQMTLPMTAATNAGSVTQK